MRKAITIGFKDQRDLWLLLGLFIGALALRLYRLSPTFNVRDDIILASYVVDSIPQQWSIQSFLTIEHAAIGNPLRLLAYALGAVQPILIFIILLFYNLAGIPITEFTWVLPVILLGAATVFPVYVLTKKLSDNNAGLVAALLLAVLPIHVMESRSLAAAWVLAFLLEVLFLILFISYLEGKKRFLIPASIILALYILSHNQFPSLAPVIFYTAFVYQDHSEPLLQRCVKTIQIFRSWKLWFLPALSFSGLLSLHIIFTYFIEPEFRGGKAGVGALGHMLDRGLSWGFYPGPVLQNWSDNIAPPLFAVSLLATSLSFGYFWRWNKKSILLVWGLSYILPFIFVVRFTIVRGYLSDAVFAFTILTAVASLDIAHRYFRTDRFAIALVVLLSMITLPYTFSSTYQINLVNLGQFFFLPSFHGSLEPDTGVKAAGYWLRKNTGTFANVLTIGVDPVLIRFYSGRKIYGIIDGTEKEGLEYLLEVKERIDYIIMKSSTGLKSSNLLGFKLCTIILNDDMPILYIYNKDGKSPPVTEVVDVYNHRFNQEYHSLNDFVGAKAYVLSKSRGLWKGRTLHQE